MIQAIATRRRAALLVVSFAVAGLTLMATPAAAQPIRLELSPFAGYRWDGQVDGDSGFFSSTVKVRDSSVFGVRLGFPVTDTFQLELLASRQSSELVRDDVFFGEPDTTDVDIDSLHLGFLFQRGNGQLLPYGVFSLGAARIDPPLHGSGDDARFAASGGGGVKVFLNRHFGLRLEARLHWVDTDKGEDTVSVSDLLQKEATAGAIFAF